MPVANTARHIAATGLLRQVGGCDVPRCVLWRCPVAGLFWSWPCARARAHSLISAVDLRAISVAGPLCVRTARGLCSLNFGAKKRAATQVRSGLPVCAGSCARTHASATRAPSAHALTGSVSWSLRGHLVVHGR